MASNQVIWTGRPSQWINATAFTKAVIFLIILTALDANGVFDDVFHKIPVLHAHKALLKTMLFTAPMGAIMWRWLQVKFHVYELTEEVFRENYGVLNRISQELELYRVNDTMVIRPFELNVMGMGNVRMHTTDASDPVVIIQAIKNPESVREMIRRYVEIQRSRKGVVEIGNR